MKMHFAGTPPRSSAHMVLQDRHGAHSLGFGDFALTDRQIMSVPYHGAICSKACAMLKIQEATYRTTRPAGGGRGEWSQAFCIAASGFGGVKTWLPWQGLAHASDKQLRLRI